MTFVVLWLIACVVPIVVASRMAASKQYEVSFNMHNWQFGAGEVLLQCVAPESGPTKHTPKSWTVDLGHEYRFGAIIVTKHKV